MCDRAGTHPERPSGRWLLAQFFIFPNNSVQEIRHHKAWVTLWPGVHAWAHGKTGAEASKACQTSFVSASLQPLNRILHPRGQADRQPLLSKLSGLLPALWGSKQQPKKEPGTGKTMGPRGAGDAGCTTNCCTQSELWHHPECRCSCKQHSSKQQHIHKPKLTRKTWKPQARTRGLGTDTN